ncbi:MAG: CehA/McbA family metallohydrolase [Gammaproteobacteria bacterium]|nr:CehA/McbA family metallohydrolase [Gammaproteobacteria bacterium]
MISLQAFLVLLITFTLSIHGHETAHQHVKITDNPRGVQTLNWQVDNVSRVITAGYPETFGIFSFAHRQAADSVSIIDNDKKTYSCIKANFIAFDIDDEFAFDIDETVTIELLIDTLQTPSIYIGFDQHSNAAANQEIKISASATRLSTVQIKLDRARFVNRGISGTDLALTTLETMLPEAELSADTNTTLTLCDLKVIRSHKTVSRAEQFTFNFKFIDEQTDKPTAVRVGLYNEQGSSAPIGENALLVKYYEREIKELNLRNFYPPYQFWPISNRYFFYVSESYQTTLPKGKYTMVVTKGPEYRIKQFEFIVNGKQQDNQPLEIKLQRWKDLPKAGWYSGDVHIHMSRAEKDNESILSVLKAEDVHISNLLEMTNSGSSHYPQYAWGESGQFSKQSNSIIPGVEGPRTAHRGHTLALNINRIIHDTDNYFQYHKFLESYQQQNAITGYAHVGSEEFNASWGLALDVPFGLVDFVEVMQATRLRTELWYEFLNLGFKLAPAAGSDYPYFDQPGAVRSYVKINNDFSTHPEVDTLSQQWFKNLKKGKTFVSNAPIITFKINEKEMGSTLKISSKLLSIVGSIQINTDYDKIDKLELVHCGNVIKTAKANSAIERGTLSLTHQIATKESGWFALRGYGQDYALAHTGAIYIENKNGSSSCTGQMKTGINKMLERLNLLAGSELEPAKELEYWETGNIKKLYQSQYDELNQRIALVREYYLKLLN